MIKKLSIGNSVNRGMFEVEDSWTVRRAFEEANIAIEGAITADGIVLTATQVDDSVAALGNINYLRSVPAKADAYTVKVLGKHGVVVTNFPYYAWKAATPFTAEDCPGMVAIGEFPYITADGITLTDCGDKDCYVDFEVVSDDEDDIKEEIFEKYRNALNILSVAEGQMVSILKELGEEKKVVFDNIEIF